MSGTETKPRFGGAAPKARYGRGTALKFRSGFRQSNKLMEPTTGLKDVYFWLT
jgi:hypothetical protein